MTAPYRSIKILIPFLLVFSFSYCIQGQPAKVITPGAWRTSLYFPLLKNKSIAIVANHTATIGEQHLVDTLLHAGFDVKRVFSPEHGFRGMADAGQKVDDAIDRVTGLPIISLYGDNKKPRLQDLEDVDIVIFDIQDVGARFYTYISTMTYMMDACAQKNIPLIVLDRPNPNGFYVDGPVLEKEFASFVGLHPVPVVHGMTVGEYAQMVNGEGWLESGLKCDLKIIPVGSYTHRDFYELPLKPSPNLPNKFAVYLYPSLCLFEGTVVSVGRGTELPFQVIGHPYFVAGSYFFTPRSMPGATKPPYMDTPCYGMNLMDFASNMKENPAQIHLFWLITFHQHLKDNTRFFNNFFDKLAGNSELRKQIEQGMSEEEIRASWQPGLAKFKETRKKYLLYEDFE